MVFNVSAGFERRKAEIVSVVHIGETTLAKRVSEFAQTSAGELTATEFELRASELRIEQDRAAEIAGSAAVPALEAPGAATTSDDPATAVVRYGCEHMRESHT